MLFVARNSNRKRLSRLRRGVQVLEAILVLPILVIVSMAVFQFGISMLLHEAVNSAAIEAAREASKIPDFDVNDATDLDKIDAVVEEVLGAHGLAVAPASGVLMIVEESGGVDCRGDEANTRACPGATTITDDDLVQVTVLAKFEFTPVPNLLKTFGFDRDGHIYESTAIETRE